MKDLDKMIMTAMKGGCAEEVFGRTNDEMTNVSNANMTNALKQIKCEIVNAEKSGRSVDEIAILKKLKKQHEESIRMYRDSGRDDLVKDESDELAVIKMLLPAEVGADEIAKTVVECVAEIRKDRTPTMRDMGFVMKQLKAQYPSVDGKLASDIIKSELMK